MRAAAGQCDNSYYGFKTFFLTCYVTTHQHHCCYYIPFPCLHEFDGSHEWHYFERHSWLLRQSSYRPHPLHYFDLMLRFIPDIVMGASKRFKQINEIKYGLLKFDRNCTSISLLECINDCMTNECHDCVYSFKYCMHACTSIPAVETGGQIDVRICLSLVGESSAQCGTATNVLHVCRHILTQQKKTATTMTSAVIEIHWTPRRFFG